MKFQKNKQGEHEMKFIGFYKKTKYLYIFFKQRKY